MTAMTSAAPSDLDQQPPAGRERPSRHPLDDRARFETRHIGPRDADIGAMLRVVGASSMDALICSSAAASKSLAMSQSVT